MKEIIKEEELTYESININKMIGLWLIITGLVILLRDSFTTIGIYITVGHIFIAFILVPTILLERSIYLATKDVPDLQEYYWTLIMLRYLLAFVVTGMILGMLIFGYNPSPVRLK